MTDKKPTSLNPRRRLFLRAAGGAGALATLATVASDGAAAPAAPDTATAAIERAAGKGDNCSMAIIKLVAPPKEKPSYTVQRLKRAV